MTLGMAAEGMLDKETESVTRPKDKARVAAFHKGIAEAARRRRFQLKLSQEETAQRSGLCRSYLSDIERGARNISLNNMIVLSQALEMPVWQFLQFAQQLGGLDEVAPLQQ